ncbi:hypothetical protein [Dyadobacter sp. 32]|uniref:hypothetical protein n=1 Tax=Dyadobacter sp. 32 TaxID=538966 RepID=UPI0011ECF2BC
MKNLEKIKRVEVSPFLFTRIQERIKISREAPFVWKLTFAAASAVVLVLNVSIMLKSNEDKEENALTEMVSSMHLSTFNTLYDE